MRAALGACRLVLDRPGVARAGGWILCLLVLVMLPGCGGCRNQDSQKTEAEKEAERLAEERERKKPDFEIEPPRAEPCADPLLAEKDEEKIAPFFYKPGHWTSAIVPTKANKEDFLGDLEVQLVSGPERVPVRLGDAPFSLAESREATLPKGQKKLLHASLFVPVGQETASALIRLSARQGTYRQYEVSYVLNGMPSYQYHFAVVARSPDRYGYLKSLDSIKPPREEIGNQQHAFHYQVALLKMGRRPPLPDGALFWTSMAYLLWDDVEPGSLTAEQQTALVDWLHWGGQLIVSGPDTLDTLRDSFLTNYLPATAAGTRELTQRDFDELNRRFTLAGQSPLVPAGKWSGVGLKLARGAQFVPGTGELLAEWRVGRGRVVASAVRLSDRGLTTWSGFDGFFNACLLRRPPRFYRELEWFWADRGLRQSDPALNSRLRYFARDAGIPFTDYASDVVVRSRDDADFGARVPPGSGVAAWRNSGPVPDHARDALQNAARVEIPTRWFVVWVVAGYLVVLVPLNWLVFVGLGRVEWAWVAAPIIALCSTVAVIRMAQLDIGFARSETELAVLELQGGYGRAHLTRYTALYTSLTTRYAFRHEDPGALVQPFRIIARRGESDTTLHYRHGNEVSLEGFVVPSNTVDMIHGEQMIDLDGPLEVMRNAQARWQVLNRTGVPLRGVGVLHRTETGGIETAWVGEMGPSSNAELTFHAAGADAKGSWFAEQREESVETKATPVPGEFNLRKLIDLAEDAGSLEPGEFRLI
ncbi:MAG: hypothetical protein NTW96_21365, partial [Planctomycetia bacterium]|nr:hypothetical protein [Planctomycetia bacterium]